MKKILITGAGGMLGAALYDYLSSVETLKCYPTSRSLSSEIAPENFLGGDLTDQKFIESLNRFDFDVVIHCAALTDIERCEKEPDAAILNNAEATGKLVAQFPRAVFIYISTDSVFDGKLGGYSETDAPNPLNVYARTKLAGEEIVSQTNASHYILRTNMYGFHRPPSGRSLFEWSFEKLSGGDSVHGFSNVFFNPLYIKQLAVVVEKIIEQAPPFGIYNAVCSESLSKLEFIRKIARTFDLPEELIVPFEIPERPVNAVRPLRTFLTNDKILSSLTGLDLSIDIGFRMLYDDFSKFIKS